MHSIRELTDFFSGSYKPGIDLITLREVLEKYRGIDWEAKTYFHPSRYQRVPLYKGEHFEMLLLCWDVGQGSLYHDHPNSGCLLKVLSGELTETRADKNGDEFAVIKTSLCRAGNVSYMHDRLGMHKIENLGKEPAMSLHVYAPVGYTPQYFEENK